MPRSSAVRESEVFTIDTSGAKRPEDLSGGSAFAAPSTGLVRRNDPRRDHSGPVRSPDARFPSFFNRVEPSGSRRQHSKVVVERHGLDFGEAQLRVQNDECVILR